jgi:quercetin dioxygenase-like cupin family protein
VKGKYTRHVDEAPRIQLTRRVVRPLITPEVGAGNMVLYVGEYEAGRRMPAHQHDDCEEILYVLSGHGRVHIGEDVEPVGPGMAIFIPRGAMHFLEIAAGQPLWLLFIFSPPTLPGSMPEVETGE